jgi:hypothetical protein
VRYYGIVRCKLLLDDHGVHHFWIVLTAVLYPSMLKWETGGTAVSVVVGWMTHDASTDSNSILNRSSFV